MRIAAMRLDNVRGGPPLVGIILLFRLLPIFRGGAVFVEKSSIKNPVLAVGSGVRVAAVHLLARITRWLMPSLMREVVPVRSVKRRTVRILGVASIREKRRKPGVLSAKTAFSMVTPLLFSRPVLSIALYLQLLK